MFTIKDVDNMAAQRDETLIKLDKQLAEAGKKIPELKEQIQAAAEAGDSKTYSSLSAELSNLENEVFCWRAHSNKLRSDPAAPIEMISEAWESYTSSRDAEFKKKLAHFNKLNESWLAAYKELLNDQAELLDIRARLLRYAGRTMKLSAQMLPCANMTTTPAGLLSINGTTLREPAAVYYLSCYVRANNITENCYNNPEFLRVTRIINGINGN